MIADRILYVNCQETAIEFFTDIDIFMYCEHKAGKFANTEDINWKGKFVNSIYRRLSKTLLQVPLWCSSEYKKKKKTLRTKSETVPDDFYI